MNHDDLQHLLDDVAAGRVDVNRAFTRLSQLPYEDLGYAHIDHHRTVRRGYGEAIFCAGKTVEQVVGIAQRMVAYGHTNVLATRACPEVLAALDAGLRSVRLIPEARLAVLNPVERELHGLVCVVTGGTSDIPVAEEAAVTAECQGSRVERLYDVGVAGIHRLLAKSDVLAEANAIVAVAGMEGALASVVGGLASCPVIAVPTSVGYGANLGGIAALLCMLNSCSPGVSVVNIDNGYGAGYQANAINRMACGERPGVTAGHIPDGIAFAGRNADHAEAGR
ncbi:MAG: nickel pincer cofactor biosynthesis protein LarB [Thermoleophilia bacterium]